MKCFMMPKLTNIEYIVLQNRSSERAMFNPKFSPSNAVSMDAFISTSHNCCIEKYYVSTARVYHFWFRMSAYRALCDSGM